MLGVGAAAVGWPRSSTAEVRPAGGGMVDIGLFDLVPVTARQNCEQWCWAASIETIFTRAGYRVPQEVLVERMFGRDEAGRLICRGAQDAEMIAAIGQRYRADGGRLFEGHYYWALSPDTLPTNKAWWNVIEHELRAGRPLLAAYNNGPNSAHAVVVTGIRAILASPEDRRLIAMIVRDPWPANPSPRMLSLEEVLDLRFIAAVSIRDVAEASPPPDREAPATRPKDGSAVPLLPGDVPEPPDPDNGRPHRHDSRGVPVLPGDEEAPG